MQERKEESEEAVQIKSWNKSMGEEEKAKSKVLRLA